MNPENDHSPNIDNLAEEPAGRPERLSVTLPTLLAGITNITILAIAAVQQNSTVLIVASLGAVIVGSLALAAETQQRTARRISGNMTSVDRKVVDLQLAAKQHGASLQQHRHLLDRRLSELANLLEQHGGGVRLITRNQFYEQALELAKNPPAEAGVIRVFNMSGPTLSSSGARSRYFEYLASKAFLSCGTVLKRVKALGDETSFQWTLNLLLSLRESTNTSLGLLAEPNQANVSPLLYPLNVHTYYGQQTFILSPGFSAQSAGPDAQVLMLGNPAATALFAQYHEDVYKLSIEVLAAGRLDTTAISNVATSLKMDSAYTLELLKKLSDSRSTA
jgi:hypothetical protein